MIFPSLQHLLSVTGLFAALVLAAPYQARSADALYAATVSSQSLNLRILRKYGDIVSPASQGHHVGSKIYSGASNNSLPLNATHASYSAPVTIGGQLFHLEIDTGSSDTWVVDSFFNCLSAWGLQLARHYCEIPNTFDRNAVKPSSIDFWNDHHFAVNYADRTGANGPMAWTEVALTPNLTVVQNVGFASNVAWSGQNTTSGILGLGLSSMTSAYPGTDYTQDVPCPLNGSTMGYDIDYNVVPCNQVRYKSLVDSLQTIGSWENGTSKSIVPGEYFSLALSRDSSGSGNGGSLTFSGVPDLSDTKVNASLPFTTVPIESLPSTGPNRSDYYTISVDGFFFPSYTNSSVSALDNNYTTSITNRANTKTRTNKLNFRRSATTFHSLSTSGNGKSQFIVDSGTTLSYLPTQLSQSFISLFNPAAYFDYNITGSGAWRVDCSSTTYIPTLGVSIGGMTFTLNPEDLVYRTTIKVFDRTTRTYVEQEACYSAIQDIDYSLSDDGDGSVVGTLGQPFLKNVLAVFDVGRGIMGFAARPEYES